MNKKIGFSSKMHLLIIISCILIAAGVAVGLIFQFTSNGYFNYSADWSDYKTVTVSYNYIDFSDPATLEELCDDAFNEAGIKSYATQYGVSTSGGMRSIIFKFTASTSDENLSEACGVIQTAIGEQLGEVYLSGAYVHGDAAVISGGKTLTMCAIGIASVIALQFVYFLIRYKISMALGVLLANVHNLALMLSLLSLLRVPVGSEVFTFAALAVILTMIGTCYYFGRLRKNIKNEDMQKLSVFEIVDVSSAETFKLGLLMICSVAIVAVLVLVLMMISTLSPLAVLSPVLCAIVTLAACLYGSLIFTPAVYSRFMLIGEKFKKKARPPHKKAEQSD